MKIPYARQSISDADVLAVTEVLRSDWLTQGPAVVRFEKAVADYCGARHAVAVNSGTSALHIACLAAGLGPGDSLWTSPNTFVASANCALYCGASVGFVDVDSRTGNLSPEDLERRLGRASRGSLPKVILPVHFAGHPCDMDRIAGIAGKYGAILIEDACHALGARYRGEPVGSGRYASMTVFSFHPVKVATTGEGGVVVTNSPALFERLALLRSHGITRDPARMQGPPHGPWYYEQIDMGFNYRLTDIQAALGESQLGRVDAFVARRRFLAARYDDLLAGLPLILPGRHPDVLPAWHLYVVRLDPARTGKNRRRVFEAMRSEGIGVNVHYIPVHTQPVYRERGFRNGDFPAAEAFYEHAISIPLFPDLTEGAQDVVVDALRRALA